MSTYQDIVQAATNLPLLERLQLLEQLWDTITPENWPAPSEEWLHEAERRSEAFDRGEIEAHDWEDARLAARRKAGLDG